LTVRVWLLWIGVAACGPSTEPAPPATTYTVVAGDTLFEIAASQGVTLQALNDANGLTTDVIEIGQVLVIPPLTQPKRTSPRRRARPSPHPTSTGPESWGLKPPPSKPCLAAPTGGTANESDLAFSTSAGLNVGDANMALRDFAPHTLKCMPMDASFAPQSPLQLDLHVGCDGRVISVSSPPNEDWPEETSRCVSDVLGYVPFPAHALPDGDWIRYPLTFTR